MKLSKKLRIFKYLINITQILIASLLLGSFLSPWYEYYYQNVYVIEYFQKRVWQIEEVTYMAVWNDTSNDNIRKLYTGVLITLSIGFVFCFVLLLITLAWTFTKQLLGRIGLGSYKTRVKNIVLVLTVFQAVIITCGFWAFMYHSIATKNDWKAQTNTECISEACTMVFGDNDKPLSGWYLCFFAWILSLVEISIISLYTWSYVKHHKYSPIASSAP
eukprot:TRINITY_DN354_c0_g1_i1.p1 TRINITY_DN354_c0_g1~~TRINITY_DN354_c0_g1_i1.p1  ORF type:complete len:217 (+),score=33.39 TRINITY_DN354_c0_g1_i1:84-734(+)